MKTTKNTAAVGGKNIGNGTGATSKENWNLSTIRQDFDALKKHANNIPEGVKRNAFLESVEGLYINMASVFKGFTPLTGPASA